MKNPSYGIKSKTISTKLKSFMKNGNCPHNLPITQLLLFQALRQKAVFLKSSSKILNFTSKIKLSPLYSSPNQILNSLLSPFRTLCFLPNTNSSVSQLNPYPAFIVWKDHHHLKEIKSFIDLSMCRDYFSIVLERNVKKNVSQNNHALKEKGKSSNIPVIYVKLLKKVNSWSALLTLNVKLMKYGIQK